MNLPDARAGGGSVYADEAGYAVYGARVADVKYAHAGEDKQVCTHARSS